MIHDDGDIGQCDDCMSDEGERRRVFRTVTIEGQQQRIYVYLCSACRAAA